MFFLTLPCEPDRSCKAVNPEIYQCAGLTPFCHYDPVLPLREPYIETTVLWPVKPITLGPNDYYVMGDNRAVSVLGPVPSERVIGKVVL